MNRKILPIILILTMIFSLIGFNTVSYAVEVTDFDGGSGSEADPWRIATAVQLNNLRYYLGPEYDDHYFILTANIDLGVYPFNAAEGWKPIGDWDTPSNYFYGNLDGGGKTISNLFIDMADLSVSGYSPVGLFGITYNAAIRNIYLENVDVAGIDCVGGLVGDAEYSLISDTHFTGSVIGTNFVGGLAGYAYGSYFTNTSFNGTATGIQMVGGLVGYQSYSSERNSFSKGFVNGNIVIGGLVGNSYKSSIFQSHSESTVTGTYFGINGSTDIGGLVGSNNRYSTINKSYATGNVTGTEELGGLVGENLDDSKITDSYAWGNVSSDSVDTIDQLLRVGGLVGNNSVTSTIENCYAVGVVSGTGEYHGGLVGYNYSVGPVTSSYSLGPDNGVGSVVDSDQMQIQSTFDGWNFYDIWVIDEGYPYLLPSGVAEVDSLNSFTQIRVDYGTPLIDVNMPFMVWATLDDTSAVPLLVTWDGGDPAYDSNTAGDYTFTGTLTLVDGIANTGEHTASITVTVLPMFTEIISVESLTNINVPNGTEYYQIAFPSSVVVTLDDEGTASLAVSWDGGTPTYDGNTKGTYVFKGTIATGDGIANTAGVFAYVNVIVETPPDAAPIITNHPEDISVKQRETATFSIGYIANPDPNFQWQLSKNGGKKWSDIPGANSRTIKVAQATIEMNGYLYRVILDNGVESPVISNAAKLTVTYETADIQISQLVGEYDSVTNEIVWVIRVYNDGPDTAQGVVIKNTLSNNTKLISVSVSQDLGYSLKGKTITVNIGEMEANREIEIEIRVLVTRATSIITNAATVTSTSLDLDLENNTSTSEVFIQ